ncbi:MAG: decarboxylating NADP(+)-dependent phosphogluconate dehydrogenase [Candidatus Auribacterota bacterium]|nr:decarboxylating NADP(+)-dependent phosphogluconate dehydrogenase [Candidatus Auribacterota bacterium]
MKKYDIGLIGLAVMGENLVLNMANHGFSVAVFNRTVSKVDDFMARKDSDQDIKGCHSIEELLGSLSRPRKVLLMVKAGQPVDAFIEKLLPGMEEGDIIIDGGNSRYTDTIRRSEELQKEGILFMGTGVSGGEEGALKGPSIMPGGAPGAWPGVEEIFTSIAARVGEEDSCCRWIGPDGAGHFVKMVHNGIEYGDMQMIAEAYWLLRSALDLSPEELAEVFAGWNEGELNSYLIEITRDIMLKVDDETGRPMLEVILDSAGQKGTGRWVVESALDLGVPLPTIAEAVFARNLSSYKEERQSASEKLSGPSLSFSGDKEAFIEKIRSALYASKICSYAQGFHLMRAASSFYKWNLNPGEIALIWRGGCIIRARFLDKINAAYNDQPDLANLLIDPYFAGALSEHQEAWREVVGESFRLGLSIPAFSSALAYYDGYRSDRISANLIQAQRDYFGAHTYERVDRPRGEFFHTEWGVGSGE